MRLSILAVFITLTTSAFAVELFRYRGAARDGGTLEYVFEINEEDLPQTVAKEKVAEIAADFMTTFYHIQIGALETQEFRTTPVPFWLLRSRTRSKDQDPIDQKVRGASRVDRSPGPKLLKQGVSSVYFH